MGDIERGHEARGPESRPTVRVTAASGEFPATTPQSAIDYAEALDLITGGKGTWVERAARAARRLTAA